MRTRIARRDRKLAWLAAALCIGAQAHAVDGVIEINQASALAGGITPGDAAGFPATLSLAASYRLTGSLELPSLATPAIEVSAAHATIDLNGFAIIGTNTCGALSFVASGHGIDSSAGANTSVRNGTVSGMGYQAIVGAVHVENVRVLCSWRGIFVSAGRRARIVGNTVSGTSEVGIGASSFADLTIVDRNVVESSFISVGKAVVTGNVVNSAAGTVGISASGVVANNTVSGGFLGIQTAGASTIVGNTVLATGSHGIAASTGSTVQGNTVSTSGNHGISCSTGCTVIGNSVRGSTGFGLFASNFTGYGDNVFTNNAGGAVTAPPIEIGTNVCDTDTTCP